MTDGMCQLCGLPAAPGYRYCAPCARSRAPPHPARGKSRQRSHPEYWAHRVEGVKL